MRLLPRDRELGWTPYAWLVYLGGVLVIPILRGDGAAEWTATLVGIAVFLVLYFVGYRVGGWRLVLVALGICLIGAVLASGNPGANVFFIYAAAFFGHLRPPRRAVGAIVLLLAGIGVLTWALDLAVYFWIPAVVFSALIGGVNVHHAEVQRANARLRMSQQEVERLAQTAERERIARDLHDLLGHTLSLVALKSELAARLIGREPERAEAEIREVERISREALKEVRSAVAGYRSQGLEGELARARLALEAAAVRLDYFAEPVTLEPREETVLALALREAVTNVIRHAGAQSCRISLEQGDGGTRLEVRDDGRGALEAAGVGLSAMRERVEGLGGRLERRVDDGTVLIVTLPRPPGRPEPEAPVLGLAPAEGA